MNITWNIDSVDMGYVVLALIGVAVAILYHAHIVGKKNQEQKKD